MYYLSHGGRGVERLEIALAVWGANGTKEIGDAEKEKRHKRKVVDAADSGKILLTVLYEVGLPEVGVV